MQGSRFQGVGVVVVVVVVAVVVLAVAVVAAVAVGAAAVAVAVAEVAAAVAAVVAVAVARAEAVGVVGAVVGLVVGTPRSKTTFAVNHVKTTSILLGICSTFVILDQLMKPQNRLELRILDLLFGWGAGEGGG